MFKNEKVKKKGQKTKRKKGDPIREWGLRSYTKQKPRQTHGGRVNRTQKLQK